MCVFVCISHTCRNLNFAKNVTTLLHWADDMKCLINSVKNSSSKKKKNPYLPTLFLFSQLRQYNNFLFLALLWITLIMVTNVFTFSSVSFQIEHIFQLLDLWENLNKFWKIINQIQQQQKNLKTVQSFWHRQSLLHLCIPKPCHKAHF